MQGLCAVHSCGFRHAAAGLAGRCAQLDDVLGIKPLVRLDHSLQNGTFAGTGASGDDGQVMLKHHLHTLVLPGRQLDTQPAPDLLHDGSKSDRLRHLQEHLYHLAGGLALLGEHMGQIDIPLVGNYHIVHNHCLHLLLHLLPVQAQVKLGDFLVQQ